MWSKLKEILTEEDFCSYTCFVGDLVYKGISNSEKII